MATAAALHPTPAHQPEQLQSTPSQPVLATSASTSNLPVPRGPVTANLNFYAPPADGSKPFNYVEQPPPGEPQRNFGEATIPVTIDDIRGHEDSYTLDANAFAALRNVPSAMTYADYNDDADIRRIYYPEVEQLLLSRVPGASRIVLFDHTIRRADPAAHRAPVTRVHIDQTPSSAAQRVRLHTGADADTLLNGRYRIINVWRPLPSTGPVRSFPLAVADSASVQDEDLVAVEHRYPNRSGETAGVRYSPSQRWKYWSGMMDDERLLLKCFDSDESVGQWGRVSHTAFVDPRTEGKEWPPRESIEVRALVFG